MSIPPYLGAAYYPEAWPLEQIDNDIALMQQAGINLVRVAEFAWARIEPKAGVYDFDWLRQVVDKLGAAEIGVILGTPTCTPPAWLSKAHPEILFVREDGTTMGHGARAHTCPNNPTYREYSARIVTKMAEVFGQDDRVVGWQIDNEVSSPWQFRSCCCPVCQDTFQATMRQRFGTIEALNDAWGLVLWSQQYQDFHELPLPEKKLWHHPSLLVAWEEFVSDAYTEKVRVQAEIIHRLATQPVGTDMMAYPGIHFGRMHAFLDVVQFNHYHLQQNLWQAAFWFDLLRTLKPAQRFWNVETMTSWDCGAPEGGSFANGYKDPGFCRVNSWMPIAQGGEANMYWHWRQHRAGQELMFGGVVSSCGRPLHVFEEVQEIAQGFEAARDLLTETEVVQPQIALVHSHLSAWMFDNQPIAPAFAKPWGYMLNLMEQAYHPLMQAHLPVDVILPEADLAPYKVLITPYFLALDEDGMRERLRAWIEAGGTWVAGPLTDIRTVHATKFTHAPYGSLEEWAGVYTRFELPTGTQEWNLAWADGHESTGGIWYDAIELRGAAALATYTDGPCAGLAAITRTQIGKGQIILLGTMPPAEEFARLVTATAAPLGISTVAQASDNLLIVPREGGGQRGLVIAEVENKAGVVTLDRPMRDLLTGNTYTAEITVPAYGVMVLSE